MVEKIKEVATSKMKEQERNAGGREEEDGNDREHGGG